MKSSQENNSAIESLVEMGNLGLQLYKSQKYPAGKMIIV